MEELIIKILPLNVNSFIYGLIVGIFIGLFLYIIIQVTK